MLFVPRTAWILHVDLDQFIAAVEVGRRPELRGRPVVVGGSGDPTRRRAVVATASYEARAFGVRSGMPLRIAARRCPDAVFLASDPAAYEEASARVMAALRALPVQVEVWGWDEAFLGARTDDPEALAADVQRAVAAATGLSCSVGVGDNKHRAKLAVGFAKPGGVYRLTADEWVDVMGWRPVDALWGIGAKTARKLAKSGIHTVTELARADPAELADQFGPRVGPWLRQLALGAGDTEVTTIPWVPRSRSRETTFPLDLTDRSEIDAKVVALAGELARVTVAEGRRVVRVAVKVRFAPFFTRTRILTLPAPTSDARDIERAALTVLDRFEPARPVRLLGVRVEFDRETGVSTSASLHDHRR
jgi:DNA polymerase IV